MNPYNGMFGPSGNENKVLAGNYYPGQTSSAAVATGATQQGNAANPANTTGTETATQVQKAGAIAMQGNPLAWWLMIVALFVGLTFVFEKYDSSSTYGNIKLSLFNMLIIGLNAVLFIVLMKYFFTIFPVKGLGSIFLSV